MDSPEIPFDGKMPRSSSDPVDRLRGLDGFDPPSYRISYNEQSKVGIL